MSDYKRVKCAKFGNENPRMLHEEPDKTQVLYYSMQGTPVYKKLIKCGECGITFDKELKKKINYRIIICEALSSTQFLSVLVLLHLQKKQKLKKNQL